MEIDFLRNKFTINEAVQLNPLVLAFVGDAIYEVFVRRYLVEQNHDMSEIGRASCRERVS